MWGVCFFVLSAVWEWWGHLDLSLPCPLLLSSFLSLASLPFLFPSFPFPRTGESCLSAAAASPNADVVALLSPLSSFPPVCSVPSLSPFSSLPGPVPTSSGSEGGVGIGGGRGSVSVRGRGAGAAEEGGMWRVAVVLDEHDEVRGWLHGRIYVCRICNMYA